MSQAQRQPLFGFAVLAVTDGKVAVDFRGTKEAAREVARRLSDDGADTLVLAGEAFFAKDRAPRKWTVWARSPKLDSGWHQVGIYAAHSDAEFAAQQCSVVKDLAGECCVVREGETPPA